MVLDNRSDNDAPEAPMYTCHRWDWSPVIGMAICSSIVHFRYRSVLCLMSQPDGSFYDGGVALGLQASSTTEPEAWSGWGIEISDLDNDGLEDAVAAGGQPIGGLSTGQTYADIIWQGIRGVQTQFKDVTDSVEFGSDSDHYGLVTADFDGDGWLEVVTSGVPGPPLYWQNHCGTNAWTSIELQAPLPNWQALAPAWS